MDMNYRGGTWEGGGGQDGVELGGGNGTTVIAHSINIFKKKTKKHFLCLTSGGHTLLICSNSVFSVSVFTGT